MVELYYSITNIAELFLLTVILDVKLKGGNCKKRCNPRVKNSRFKIGFLFIECSQKLSKSMIFCG